MSQKVFTRLTCDVAGCSSLREFVGLFLMGEAIIVSIEQRERPE